LDWFVPSHHPWLLVVSGRPGTGKSTLARSVVRATGACYLRVDVVETALAPARDEVGADGYAAVHGLALSNLELGNDVVVDAVNPVPAARAGWAPAAARVGARLLVVETSLPDGDEHRRRVETRTADIPGHRVPTWAEVREDGWVPWDEERDGPRTVIDTTESDAALDRALALVSEAEDHR
jgi:predicted kinase